jgi:hypothetical protein
MKMLDVNDSQVQPSYKGEKILMKENLIAGTGSPPRVTTMGVC